MSIDPRPAIHKWAKQNGLDPKSLRIANLVLIVHDLLEDANAESFKEIHTILDRVQQQEAEKHE
jgi:hypothetical protein